MLKHALIGLLASLGWLSGAFAIVNGNGIPSLKFNQLHPGSYNTVALLKLLPGGEQKAFCTGSIIAEDLILTAKHCVNGLDPRTLRVFFGPSDKIIDPSLVREVSAVYEHGETRNWQDYFPNQDVAVVRLKGFLPEGFHSLEILRSHSVLIPNGEITIVGYGNQVASTHEIRAGHKLTADLRFQEYIHNSHFNHLLLLDSDNGQGACHGDSGGPAYVFVSNGARQGRWYLAGITNGFDLALTPKTIRRTGDELFPYTAHCDKGEVIYTFAGAYWSWIEQVTGQRFQWTSENKPTAPATDIEQGEFRTFQEWCEKVNIAHPAWLTVKQLMIDAASRKSPAETDRDIFFNCRRANELLEAVTELTLDGDSFLSSFAPIGTLKNLRKLTVRNRDVSDLDFEFLLGAAKLESLNLIDVGLKTLRPLSALKSHPSLRRLLVTRSKVSNAEDLAGWTSLTVLDLSQNELSSTKFLSSLTNLKELNLAVNRLANAEEVSSLADLEALDLSGNSVGTLDLSALAKLRRLRLANVGLPDHRTILTVSVNLEELDLSGNSFTRLAALSRLNRLKDLRINNNNLSDVGFLKDMIELRNLELSGNQLRDLRVISRLKNLRRLLIGGNAVEDLSPLIPLRDDAQVWAGGNPVRKSETHCSTRQGPQHLRRFCRGL